MAIVQRFSCGLANLRLTTVRMFLATGFALVGSAAAVDASDQSIQLSTADRTTVGRLFARDAETAWLLNSQGSLQPVVLAEVTQFNLVNQRFRPQSLLEMRAAKQREFAGSGKSVAVGPHYVVSGSVAAARTTVELLEQLFNELELYCQLRRLPYQPPEFPLLAVVSSTREEFDRDCRSEGMLPQAALRGYYRQTTNRFLLYEDPDASVAEFRDVVTHEAIHQFGFNTGLHTRLGANPKWVVEGLAMVLEPAATRKAAVSGRPMNERVNLERLRHYRTMSRHISAFTLKDLIETDAVFAVAPLDAYALAWAASFYLIETRPVEYNRFLVRLARHAPLQAYSAGQRLSDFKAAFGDDLMMLEANMQRYFERLPRP